MATNQKKKSGSGNRSRSNSSNKKNSNSRSSSRSKQKNSSGGDGLTKVLLILLIALVIVLIVINRDKLEESSSEPTPTPYPTAALTPTAMPTKAVEPEATKAPEPTKQAEPTAAPTPTPTTEPTPTIEPQVPDVSLEEANGLMAQVVTVDGYSYELSDEKFRVDDKLYYSYIVVYKEVEEKYHILVDQQDGSMYYYNDQNEKSPLEHFPMDWTEAPNQGGSEVTVELAKEWLADISHTSLALPAALADCELSLDTWKTVVSGAECYCLNVFYQGALAGTIYFTDRAEQVYYLNEFGEFIQVR